MTMTIIAAFGAIICAVWLKRVLDRPNRVIRALTQQVSAAKELQQRLDNLETAPFGYMEIDVQGIVRRVNQRECKFRGLKPDQVVGKQYWDLEPSADRERVKTDFQRNIIGDLELNAFRRTLEGAGTAFVEVSPQAVRSNTGRITGIQLFSIDITEAVRLKEEVARCDQKSHAMLSALPDAVFHVDSTGSILDFTPRPYLAMPGEGTIGRKLADVLPPDCQELINTNLYFARTKHSERTFEYCLQHEGKPLYSEFRLVPFTWDQVVVLVRDITTRRMAQNKAQQYMRELMQKNENLAQALIQAQETKNIKAELLQTMGLELRTPMSGMVGLTAKLLDTMLEKEQREVVEALGRSSRTVLSTLTNILDSSRLESKVLPLAIRPFSVRDVIHKVVSRLSTQASKEGFSLEWGVANEVPVTVQGDPVRLEKILVNLAENAIRFTSQGQVSLSVGLVAERAEHWTLKFTVQDTGSGISSSRLPTLFESYPHVDNGNSSPKGSNGLGLSICKQLVEMMAGEIAVESSPGKGSIFSFNAVFERCPSNGLGPSAPGVKSNPMGEILEFGYR